MKRLARLIAVTATYLAFLIVPLAGVQTVAAHHCFGHVGTGNVSVSECADAGACLDTAAPDCENPENAERKINDTIKLVINLLSFIVGVVAVIMIIIAGLKYITSGGDSNNVASAKNTILYAIIGLVIVALAQVIVRFVLQKASPDAAAATLWFT